MTYNPLVRLDRPIIIFSGNFGSGKSEVAVNTAFQLAEQWEKVAIVDLDVVNPYFRCREAREQLELEGIEVIAPDGKFSSADLPIILPEIRGRILKFDGIVILDVGGDDLGARALASLNDVLKRKSHHFLMVVNERRPFTKDVDGTVGTIERIETASHLEATGIVGNTHLMEHTTVDTIKKGYELISEVSKERELPLMFVTSPKVLYEDVLKENFQCPVLPLTRRLRPPWMEGQNNGAATPRPGKPWGKAPAVSLPGGDE